MEAKIKAVLYLVHSIMVAVAAGLKLLLALSLLWMLTWAVHELLTGHDHISLVPKLSIEQLAYLAGVYWLAAR